MSRERGRSREPEGFGPAVRGAPEGVSLGRWGPALGQALRMRRAPTETHVGAEGCGLHPPGGVGPWSTKTRQQVSGRI